MLSSPKTVRLLDEESRKEGGVYSWTKLWKKVFLKTDLEMSKHFKDAEKITPSSSSITITRVKNEKAKVTVFMNLVLQKCDQCLIKPEVLVDNLLTLLSSAPTSFRMRQSFGALVIDMLLKRVLSSEVYVKGFRIGEADVTNQWKTMLSIAFEMLKSSSIEGMV